MILITGMHRSGTSFVSQLLHEMGVDFGDPAAFLPSDQWNPEGYFEHLETVLINDRLILGDALYDERYRRCPPGQRPLPAILKMSLAKAIYLVLSSRRGIEKRVHRHRAQMTALARERAGLAVKDPRFTLTLRAWLPFLDEARILFSFRHPGEVARSLRRREKIPLGLGLRLWNFHTRCFLEDAAGREVTLVDFNRFFDPGTCEAEVDRCWAFAEPRGKGAGDPAILARVLKGDLHHHRSEHSRLPEPTRTLYERLRALHACGPKIVLETASGMR